MNRTLQASLDHIVVAAPTLEAGAAYVHRTLGVTPQAGGEHARMATHNRLLNLGERTYLEVISIDPGASRPDRPRWFQLDDPETAREPRLLTWVIRTNDIEAAAAASPVPLGTVECMRRGSLEWLITIPEDGGLALDGIMPTLIEWPEGVHPTGSLEDRGCRLVSLRGFHPDARDIEAFLRAIGFQGSFAAAPPPAGARPYLSARIGTPAGSRELTGARRPSAAAKDSG